MSKSFWEIYVFVSTAIKSDTSLTTVGLNNDEVSCFTEKQLLWSGQIQFKKSNIL